MRTNDASVSPATNVYSSGVSYPSGFGTAPNLALNSTAVLNNGAIQLTGGGEFQVGSVFTRSRLDLSDAVVSTFDFQFPAGNAAGFAYVFQDNGPNATGSSGGGLGYGNTPGESSPGITNSVAITFDLHNNQGEGANSVRLEYNGVTSPAGAVDLTPYGIDLHSGHRFTVKAIAFEDYNPLAYIDLTIIDTRTQAKFDQYLNLTTHTLLPGNWGYVGFTSSSGTSTVSPTIYDWTIAQPDLSGGNLPGFFPLASQVQAICSSTAVRRSPALSLN